MHSSLDIEIRQQLSRYLRGEISLADFQAWFVPATWDVHLTRNAGAETLTAKIELLLAERTSGHRTAEELRRLLGDVLGAYSVGNAPTNRLGSPALDISFQNAMRRRGAPVPTHTVSASGKTLTTRPVRAAA